MIKFIPNPFRDMRANIYSFHQDLENHKLDPGLWVIFYRMISKNITEQQRFDSTLRDTMRKELLLLNK
jgi:hypothetical protein